MMYKDKNRQREAVKLATRRYRAKCKGITQEDRERQRRYRQFHQGATPEGVTLGITDDTSNVIPEPSKSVIPVNDVILPKPKPQSYSRFVGGYVPPGRRI